MAVDRMVLRAELVQDGRTIVAHTIEVTARSAFVRTDERLELGSSLELRLSFPRLFAPVNAKARVVSRNAGSGHGYWPGFMLELDGADDRIAGLVREIEVGDAQLSTYRILVVEDSATTRDVMQLSAAHFSTSFRIEMVSCDNIEEAQRHLDGHDFDLAVIDLFLPGDQSGAELVSYLRASGDDLPVIGISVGGPGARRAFLEAGADIYLDKPVMLRDMFATLRQLVRHARQGK